MGTIEPEDDAPDPVDREPVRCSRCGKDFPGLWVSALGSCPQCLDLDLESILMVMVRYVGKGCHTYLKPRGGDPEYFETRAAAIAGFIKHVRELAGGEDAG